MATGTFGYSSHFYMASKTWIMKLNIDKTDEKTDKTLDLNTHLLYNISKVARLTYQI